MSHPLHDRAAIVGIGQTEFSKNSGRSELQLAAEAVTAALDDAGIEPERVDGMVTFTLDHNDDIEVARAIGAGELTFFSRIPHGGGAAVSVVQQAAMAVATGIADCVVCYRALNGRSEQRYSQGVASGPTTSDMIHWGWYMPFGLLTPASWVAMMAQRYMHEYGAKATDLAQIAISTRNHAVNNPNAFFYRKPLTLEEHQSARPIAEPLRLFDCCQETDGGCACVVTSVERARDLRRDPVVIRGIAQAAGRDQEVMTSFYREKLSEIPEMERVARQVYEQSGLGPDDVQAAVLYDAFSPNVMMQFESWGFCGRGEAKDFIQNGNIEVGGRLPVNTHGGQLSEAYIHGMNGVNEGVRLLRGTSPNQPEGIEHVLVTAGIGVPTSGMILGRP